MSAKIPKPSPAGTYARCSRLSGDSPQRPKKISLTAIAFRRLQKFAASVPAPIETPHLSRDEMREALCTALREAVARGDRDPFFNFETLGFREPPKIPRELQTFRLRMNLMLLTEVFWQAFRPQASETGFSNSTFFFCHGRALLREPAALSEADFYEWQAAAIEYQVRALEKLATTAIG